MSFVPTETAHKTGRAYIGCADSVKGLFAGDFCDHHFSGSKTASAMKTKKHQANVDSLAQFEHKHPGPKPAVITEDTFCFAPVKCAPGKTHSKQASEINATVRPLGPHNLQESAPPVRKYMPRKTLAVNRRNLGVSRQSMQMKKSAPRKTLALSQRNLNTHQTFTHASFKSRKSVGVSSK